MFMIMVCLTFIHILINDLTLNSLEIKKRKKYGLSSENIYVWPSYAINNCLRVKIRVCVGNF